MTPAATTSSSASTASVTPMACLPSSSKTAPTPTSSDSGHTNRFEGLHDFSSLRSAANDDGGDTISGGKKFKRDEAEDGGSRSSKKQKREDRTAATAAAADDEKYKPGHGLVGKAVKTPWYLSKASSLTSDDASEGVEEARMNGSGKNKNGSGKKSIEELREERSRREKKEKETERGIFNSIVKKKGFSWRQFCVDRRKTALADGSMTMCWLSICFAKFEQTLMKVVDLGLTSSKSKPKGHFPYFIVHQAALEAAWRASFQGPCWPYWMLAG